MYKNSIIYKKLALSELQLAVCDITGITISLNVPAIHNFVLEYSNPYSIFANAHKIADLPYKDQVKIPATILAGSLLTLLNHYELINDHLSALERNLILSNVPVHSICNAMRLLITSTKLRLRTYPHLSLDQQEEQYASINDVLKNWIEVCEKPYHFERTTVESTQVAGTTLSYSIKIKDKKPTISSFTRKTIKNLIEKIISEETLSPKLCTLLKLLGTGNNLVDMHASIKDKIVDRLYVMTSEHAHHLAELIISINKNTAETEEDDINPSEISKMVPSTARKLTLKEILQQKLTGIPIEHEVIEVSSSDNAETSFLSALQEANSELVEETEDEDADIDTDFAVTSSFDPDEF